jgi:pimeloyl-ACP methyl ester carboxylesterase
VLAVIRALDPARYILVGHSMGGKASQWLAAQRPSGLVGLALIASSPPSPMPIDESQREQMRKAYADRDAIEWSLDNVLVGSPIAETDREQLVADALRLSLPARQGWLDIGSREDFSSQVAAIEVPVLIVAGELDRVDPTALVKEHILPCYPSASVRFLVGKGHLLPVEAPVEVAELVGDFATAAARRM